MYNQVFVLAARAEHAALYLERARLTVEARRAEVEAAKIGVETARAVETDARASLEAVLTDAEGLGLNKRAFKQAADDRLQSLISSGLLQVTPFGEGDEVQSETAPAAKVKTVRTRVSRGDATATSTDTAQQTMPSLQNLGIVYNDLPPSIAETSVLHVEKEADSVEMTLPPKTDETMYAYTGHFHGDESKGNIGENDIKSDHNGETAVPAYNATPTNDTIESKSEDPIIPSKLADSALVASHGPSPSLLPTSSVTTPDLLAQESVSDAVTIKSVPSLASVDQAHFSPPHSPVKVESPTEPDTVTPEPAPRPVAPRPSFLGGRTAVPGFAKPPAVDPTI